MATKDRMKWNNCIGWKFTLKLINVGYGIRACWVEKIMKINKHTPTLIKYSRVFIAMFVKEEKPINYHNYENMKCHDQKSRSSNNSSHALK